MGGPEDAAEPTTHEFARTLVRAGMILEPHPAIEVMNGWINGEPYRYRMKMLLTGVICDSPLSIGKGVRITPLPNNSNDLRKSLPSSLISQGFNFLDFSGRALLEIDGTSTPALYRPSRPPDQRPFCDLKSTWASGELPSLTNNLLWRERFTDTLSLACNQHVCWTHIWRDTGAIRAFSSIGVGCETHASGSPHHKPIRIEEQHLETVREIDVQRHDKKHNEKALDVAISRWISSKRPFASMADSFIDIRIALESLYTDDSSNELSFRLALFGAWELGTDYQTRQSYFDRLRDAYKVGSKAVHNGHIENTRQNRDKLLDAQKVCREAILKRLALQRPPDGVQNRIARALGALE